MSTRDRELSSKASNTAYVGGVKGATSIKEQASIIKDQASELTGSLKQEARNIYHEGGKKAKHAYEQVKDYTHERKNELTQSVTNYVQQEPIKALAIAALAGAFLAFLMKK